MKMKKNTLKLYVSIQVYDTITENKWRKLFLHLKFEMKFISEP